MARQPVHLYNNGKTELNDQQVAHSQVWHDPDKRIAASYGDRGEDGAKADIQLTGIQRDAYHITFTLSITNTGQTILSPRKLLDGMEMQVCEPDGKPIRATSSSTPIPCRTSCRAHPPTSAPD